MLLHYSPLLKKTCVRQVVLDKWFPLTIGNLCGDLRAEDRAKATLPHGKQPRTTDREKETTQRGGSWRPFEDPRRRGRPRGANPARQASHLGGYSTWINEIRFIIVNNV